MREREISRPAASKTRLFIGDFRGGKPVNSTASTEFMKWAIGIESVSEAWEVTGESRYFTRQLKGETSSDQSDSTVPRNVLPTILPLIK